MTIPELIPFNTTTTVCKECDNIKNPPELAFISTTCCGFISTVVQFNSPATSNKGYPAVFCLLCKKHNYDR